jgi:hypothetical protein
LTGIFGVLSDGVYDFVDNKLQDNSCYQSICKVLSDFVAMKLDAINDRDP